MILVIRHRQVHEQPLGPLFWRLALARDETAEASVLLPSGSRCAASLDPSEDRRWRGVIAPVKIACGPGRG